MVKQKVISLPAPAITSAPPTPPAPASSSFGEELYSGAAEVGRFTASIQLVIAIIFGLLMVIGGIFLFFSKSQEDPTKSSAELETESKNRKKVGAIFFVIGLIVIGFSWYWWSFVKRNKVAAAATGAGTIVDWVTPDNLGGGFNGIKFY